MDREGRGQQSRVRFSWDFLAAVDRSNRLNYIPNVCIERPELGLQQLNYQVITIHNVRWFLVSTVCKCIKLCKHRNIQHGLGHEGLQYFSIDKIYRQIHRKCKYCLMPGIQWVNKRTEIILNWYPESLMMFVVTQSDVTSVMESHTPGSDVRPVSDDTFHYFDWKYKVGRNKFFGNTIHPISTQCPKKNILLFLAKALQSRTFFWDTG